MSTLKQESPVVLLPSGWKIKRLKDFSKVCNGGTPKPEFIFSEKTESTVYWATPTDFKDIEFNLNKTGRVIDQSKISDAGNLLKKEDILISCRAPVGKVAFVTESLSFNQGCKSITVGKTDYPKYYFYSLIASKNYLQQLSNGTTFQEISTTSLKNSFFSVPPKEQQTLIANFLDTETSKIDRKISILEQKYEKLEEYKQSVIFESVTKGLDKKVPMKDSGIDWVGDIPEHWEVKRVKDFYKLGMGQTILKEDLIEGGKIPVYSATAEDKFFGYVDKINNPLNIGDLVIPARGNSIGHVKLVNQTVACTQTTIYMKNKSKINSNYVYYYLIGNKTQIFFFDDTAIPQITVEQINGKLTLIPSKIEQKKISTYLSNVCSKIDKQKEIIKKKVALLKEYKQAIIYEAVTGKIEIE